MCVCVFIAWHRANNKKDGEVLPADRQHTVIKFSLFHKVTARRGMVFLQSAEHFFALVS